MAFRTLRSFRLSVAITGAYFSHSQYILLPFWQEQQQDVQMRHFYAATVSLFQRRLARDTEASMNSIEHHHQSGEASSAAMRAAEDHPSAAVAAVLPQQQKVTSTPASSTTSSGGSFALFEPPHLEGSSRQPRRGSVKRSYSKLRHEQREQEAGTLTPPEACATEFKDISLDEFLSTLSSAAFAVPKRPDATRIVTEPDRRSLESKESGSDDCGDTVRNPHECTTKATTVEEEDDIIDEEEDDGGVTKAEAVKDHDTAFPVELIPADRIDRHAVEVVKEYFLRTHQSPEPVKTLRRLPTGNPQRIFTLSFNIGPYSSVAAIGCSRKKRPAYFLCYQHAARLIDHYCADCVIDPAPLPLQEAPRGQGSGISTETQLIHPDSIRQDAEAVTKKYLKLTNQSPSTETIKVLDAKQSHLRMTTLAFKVQSRTVVATGISRKKKIARALCFQHAACLINYYSADNMAGKEPLPLEENSNANPLTATAHPVGTLAKMVASGTPTSPEKPAVVRYDTRIILKDEVDTDAKKMVDDYLKSTGQTLRMRDGGCATANPRPFTLVVIIPLSIQGNAYTAVGLAKKHRTAQHACYMHAVELIKYYSKAESKHDSPPLAIEVVNSTQDIVPYCKRKRNVADVPVSGSSKHKGGSTTENEDLQEEEGEEEEESYENARCETTFKAEYVAVPQEVDQSAKKRVAKFLASTKQPSNFTQLSVMGSLRAIVVATQLPLSVNGHSVTATGRSTDGKISLSLCFMHADRLIKHYSAQDVTGEEPLPLEPKEKATELTHDPLLPSARDDSNDEVKAIVAQAAAGLRNRPTGKDGNVLENLNKQFPMASKEMNVTWSNDEQTFVAALVLHKGRCIQATGRGTKKKHAMIQCALHALAILKLLQQRQSSTQGDGTDVESLISDSDAHSAPLSSVAASMDARLARLYGFYGLLFADADGEPTVSFKRGRLSRVYLCTLTLAGITCDGRGVNRFEAERAALVAVLTEMELHDPRMRELNAFLVQYPKATAESVSSIALPADLRKRVLDGVSDIRRTFPPEVASEDAELLLDAAVDGDKVSKDQVDLGSARRKPTMQLSVEEQSLRDVVTIHPVALRDASSAQKQAKIGKESKNDVGTALMSTEEARENTKVRRGHQESAYAAQLRKDLKTLRASPRYLSQFHPRRSTLAITTVKDDILSALEKHRAVVVCGTTGCGKTTQVPQFIFDDAIQRGEGDTCKIIVTQPRRISAFSVSERIARERLSDVGDDVGYAVRLEYKPGRHITMCTTGVLLQILSSYPDLEHVSHIIIDEVHEREVNCDVVMALIKRLQERNKHLKVVLMSATLQAGIFQQYFNDAPVVQVEGAVYPVTVKYLEDIAETPTASGALFEAFSSPMFDVIGRQKRWKEAQLSSDDEMWRRRASHDHSENDTDERRDSRFSSFCYSEGGGRFRHGSAKSLGLTVPPKTDYNLIAYLVHKSIKEHMGSSTKGKSILIFLPGWRELMTAKNAIENFSLDRDDGGDASSKSGKSNTRPQFHIILLHSTVDSAKQRQCFEPAPPGKVKVVIATNIAESGITIDDAAVVIDTGLIKQTTWSSARQWKAGNMFGRSDSGASSVSSAAELQGSRFSTQLSLQYASRANCTQRKGRAGRTQGGICYRLFTRDTWDAMPSFLEAEIHRVSLSQVLLKILSLGYSKPAQILETFLEPPSPVNVKVSMQQLKSLGAVDAAEALTPLGMYLSKLPCDPHIGKMILMGAVLRCLDSVLTVAACSDVSPFVTSRELAKELQQKRQMFARGAQSDHVCFLNAFNAFCFNGESNTFAQLNYMNAGSMTIISRYKQQYRDILLRSGFISDAEMATGSPTSVSTWNHHLTTARSFSSSSGLPMYTGKLCVDTSVLSEDAQDVSLVKACVCSALFPNVAMLHVKETIADQKSNKKRVTLQMSTKALRSISPSRESVCRRFSKSCSTEEGEGEGKKGDKATRRQRQKEAVIDSLIADSPSESDMATNRSESVGSLFPSLFYVYEQVFTVTDARKDFLTNVSSISIWALLLFGAGEANIDYKKVLGLCIIDKWIVIHIDAASYEAITVLRTTMHECVWRKYKSPFDSLNNDALDTIRRLCKDVLKAPLRGDRNGGPRLSHLQASADAGTIVNPVVVHEKDATAQNDRPDAFIDYDDFCLDDDDTDIW